MENEEEKEVIVDHKTKVMKQIPKIIRDKKDNMEIMAIMEKEDLEEYKVNLIQKF